MKLSTSRALRSASNFSARLATRLRVLAAVCAVAGTFAASATLAADATVQSPLVDRIWDVRAQRFIHSVDLTTVLAKADFVLLGEIHDNAEQHRRQAAVIASLATAGRRPAIAFEQFDREYQPDLDRAIKAGADASRVAAAGHFDRKGWGWDNYGPLIELALDIKLPVVAANLSRPAAREIAAHGFSGLRPSAAELGLERTWSKAREETLVDDLVDNHCGQLPRKAAGAVALAQRARDAIMADQMLAHRSTGVVLIAGAGHARRDLAVPLYLKVRAPDARTISVGLVETRPGTDAPDAYAETGARGASDPPYDYVWFTPAAEREDPCAGLRDHAKKQPPPLPAPTT